MSELDLKKEFIERVVKEEPSRCFDLLVEDEILASVWEEMVQDYMNSAICGTCNGGGCREFPCYVCRNTGMAFPKGRRELC